MRKDDCFQLGYVIKPHGLKGEVSILMDVDFPEDYSEMESVFLEIDRRLVPFFIESISISGNRAIILFEDIQTFEQAGELKGCGIYLPDSILPEMAEDQFYFHEIIGFAVTDEHHGDIGEITNVYASGKQDLLAISWKGHEILVPVSDDIIKQVDRENQVLKVILPDGLLEIYTTPDNEN